jgi:hypothetical protein
VAIVEATTDPKHIASLRFAFTVVDEAPTAGHLAGQDDVLARV